MLKRILAIFHARNLEFVRDRSTLSWNIILPVVLMFGLSFIFGGGTRAELTVGILQPAAEIDTRGSVLPGAHAAGSTSSTWVSSRNARARFSTWAEVTSLNPLMPNWETANEPMTLP